MFSVAIFIVLKQINISEKSQLAFTVFIINRTIIKMPIMKCVMLNRLALWVWDVFKKFFSCGALFF